MSEQPKTEGHWFAFAAAIGAAAAYDQNLSALIRSIQGEEMDRLNREAIVSLAAANAAVRPLLTIEQLLEIERNIDAELKDDGLDWRERKRQNDVCLRQMVGRKDKTPPNKSQRPGGKNGR